MWCTLNWPGSWSDTALARHLYKLLKELPEGFSIAADSAFTPADMASLIIRPLKSDEMVRQSSTVSVKQFKHHRLALSIRQTAKGGMGSLQQMCGCLLHWLSTNPKEQCQLLDLCAHYYNFWTISEPDKDCV
jgi:hypothetical protein